MYSLKDKPACAALSLIAANSAVVTLQGGTTFERFSFSAFSGLLNQGYSNTKKARLLAERDATGKSAAASLAKWGMQIQSEERVFVYTFPHLATLHAAILYRTPLTPINPHTPPIHKNQRTHWNTVPIPNLNQRTPGRNKNTCCRRPIAVINAETGQQTQHRAATLQAGKCSTFRMTGRCSHVQGTSPKPTHRLCAVFAASGHHKEGKDHALRTPATATIPLRP